MKPSTRREPDAIDGFHRALRNRTPFDGLDAVENEVPAIERGNRQKVQNADADGQRRDQLNQPFEAELCRLSGHLGDLDRAAKLAFVLAPDDETLQELSGPAR